MAKVVAVCISEKKGVRKHSVPRAEIKKGVGLVGDAHGDDAMRRISLLAKESVDKMQGEFHALEPGDFAENILTEGLIVYELPIGTRLKVGTTELEITQIGKECHKDCEIRRLTGDCAMPREGVFAEVVEEGEVRVGDEIKVLGNIEVPAQKRYTAAVLTVSDKCSAGEREDKSGPVVKEMLEEAGYEVVSLGIVPDEQALIEAELKRLADEEALALVVTTGGTGFAPRDITPEATIAVCERLAPGIAEAMRAASLLKTERAMLSRGVSGIRARSLIINLPGSPKAARENLEAVLSALAHGVETLREPQQDHI